MNRIFFALVLFALIGGCEKPQLAESNTPEAENVAKAKALAAKADLFSQLSTRLTEVIKSQGPAAAIEVCSNEAPQITQAIGNQHGIKIGRTSLKLRNQNNVAPSWAADLLYENVTDLQVLPINENTFGALIPITLQKKCLICHGPVDSLAPSIKQNITKLYPDDEATGFSEGDLRGWFWVEVPSPNEDSNG